MACSTTGHTALPAGQSKLARFSLGSFSQVQVLDLADNGTNPALKGFKGGFHDGTFGYLVPNSNNDGSHANTVRFDLSSFSGVQAWNLADTNDALKGFSTGFHDGNFGYAGMAASGKVVRFCTSDDRVLDLALTDPQLAGLYDGFQDGTYGYLASQGGRVARFDLGSLRQVQVLDVVAKAGLNPTCDYGYGSAILEFRTAPFHDGAYGYLFPNQILCSAYGQKVVRFDLASFSQV